MTILANTTVEQIRQLARDMANGKTVEPADVIHGLMVSADCLAGLEQMNDIYQEGQAGDPPAVIPQECPRCNARHDMTDDRYWRLHHAKHLVEIEDHQEDVQVEPDQALEQTAQTHARALEGETIETAVVRYGGHSVQILELRFKSAIDTGLWLELSQPQPLEDQA